MPADNGGEFLGDVSFREGAADGLLVSSLDSDPVLRFFDRLRITVITSMDRALPTSTTRPAVFVCSESARRDSSKLGFANRIVDIDQKTVSEWAGMIHLVGLNATAGWSLPLDGPVESIFGRLESAGLGALPLCIVYPATRLVSCFKDGAENEQSTIRFELPVSTRLVTMLALIEVIEEHRRRSLMSPQVCPPDLWVNSRQHQPSSEAERHIQWGVAVALRNSFRPITADVEQITPTGRIDICMTNPQPAGGAIHPAIVELKALRSESSTGQAISRHRNLIWVAAGYRQARAYRDDKQATLGLLACFDMRSDKDDLTNDTVLKLANARYFDDNMAARIFKVHGRTEDAQEELATAIAPSAASPPGPVVSP